MTGVRIGHRDFPIDRLHQDSDGSPSSAPKAQSGQPGYLRLKLGDTLEGFKLSEIHDKRVIFTKGTSRVEVSLDFFRRAEETKMSAPTPASPGGLPRVPRRDRMPVPPPAQ